MIGNFNTVNLPGVPSDAVEAALGSGEGAAVEAIKRLQAGTFPGPAERVAIAWFVALHFARSPAFRRFCDDLTGSFQAWLGEISASWLAKSHPEALGLIKEQISFDQDDHVATMLDAIETMWRSLVARSWTIVEVPNMVTSDFPVLLNPVPELAPFGLGIGNADEIAFALGPLHALVLSKPYGGTDRRVTLEGEGEAYLNLHAS